MVSVDEDADSRDIINRPETQPYIGDGRGGIFCRIDDRLKQMFWGSCDGREKGRSFNV